MAEGKTRIHYQEKAILQRFVLIGSILLLLIQSSSASSSGDHPSWNPRPLRSGVQSSSSLAATTSSSRNRHPNNDNNKRRRFHPFVAVKNKHNHGKEALYGDDDGDDEEWFALFPQEEQTQYASQRQRTTNIASSGSIGPSIRKSFEGTRGGQQAAGFRQSVNLPAFLTRRTRRQAEEESILSAEDYEEAYVVPVAAISVSSKVNTGQQASFSSGLQSSRHHHQSSRKPTEPTLNLRKEASLNKASQNTAKAGASDSGSAGSGRPLVFWENMICGAISRSVAQTVMHPANTMKTLLQQSNSPPLGSFMKPSKLPVLFRGAGANFVLSVPHGAINFAVLELVRKKLSTIVQTKTNYKEERIGPALDFMSSAISTICCSVVSTPQMMITDNIMAGNYPNLPQAVRGLASQGNGIQGFYARGWLPGLVGKIPSYALTWTFFQQLKLAQQKLSGRESTNLENSVMGCLASATTVTIMMPLDTIKTRLVTQGVGSGSVPYKGIVDCGVRVIKEEGFKSFYKGLQPRLISVVPMIGIQFTVYEFMKRVMQQRSLAAAKEQQQKQQPVQTQPILSIKTMQKKKSSGSTKSKQDDSSDFDPYSSLEQLQESCMEVAASPEHPYPAPHFLRVMRRKNGSRDKNRKAG